MGRIPISCCIALMLWATGTARSPGQPCVRITQVDISRFPEVTVFFKVVEGAGGILGRIRQEDIQLLEDGKPIRISQFLSPGSFRITTALVVDCSGSMADPVPGVGTKLDAAKAACRAFLEISRADDDNSLVMFNTTATTVCPFGSTRNSLLAAVDSLRAGGGTAWRDAVAEALAMLAVRHGRRSVILLTDGQDNSSVQTVSRIAEAALNLQIPVYAIALGEAHQIDDRELRQLAEATRGSYLLMPTPQNLAELYEAMAKSMQEELAVTYTTNRPYYDGTRRTIQILIRAGNTDLKTEGSYLEPHIVNIRSHLGVFVFWFVLLGISYAVPFAVDARRKHALRRLCNRVFEDDKEAIKLISDQLPTVELITHVHPLALLRDAAPRIVSVRIDTVSTPPKGGVFFQQPLHLIILLDLSASMEGERLSAACAAIRSVSAGLADRDSLSLLGFSDNVSTIIPPMRIGHARGLISSQLKNVLTGARTMLAPALEKASEFFPPPHVRKHRKTCVVILSDGKIEDRGSALEAGRNLRDQVEIYAMGIGADYDHEFLAELCGGKEKVDHLDSAIEATNAFARLVRLFGRTATANTRMRFRTPAGVSLKRVIAERYAKELPIVDHTVPVADLPCPGTLSYLAEFEIRPTVVGKFLIAECALLFDLPAWGKSDCRSETPLVIEITHDPARANVPNPEVVRLARIIQACKLAEKAEEDLRMGDVRGATTRIKRASQQLQGLGEREKAEALQRLCERLEAESDNPDLGIKRIRGTTKRLTE